jgi:hypothetical protein
MTFGATRLVQHIIVVNVEFAEKCGQIENEPIVFSIVLSRQPSPALLFFKSIEVETKFPFTNSISEFSRSQDPSATFGRLARVVTNDKFPLHKGVIVQPLSRAWLGTHEACANCLTLLGRATVERLLSL